MENSKHSNYENYKNENIETKYLNIMQKTQFLKVNNSLPFSVRKRFYRIKR